MINKTVLVLGGAGYVGSKVALDLVNSGFEVVVVDNLSKGYKFLVNSKCLFFRADINDTKVISKIFNQFKFKAVFHFAALISVSDSQKWPKKYYMNNVIGTKNILKIFIKKKIKYFIFSSTAAVYGFNQISKVSEKSTLSPANNYGSSKLAAENLIKKFSLKHNFKYAILRYFNVIGADSKLRTGQINTGALIKNICHNIVKRKYIIKVYGNKYNTIDGTGVRDYIDINDLSKLHIESLNKLKNYKSFIVNCGYGFGYSVLEIINLFSRIIKKKIKIFICSKRKGDIGEIYCDNLLLKELFPKWKKKVTIKKSLENSLKWEKKIKNEKFY